MTSPNRPDQKKSNFSLNTSIQYNVTTSVSSQTSNPTKSSQPQPTKITISIASGAISTSSPQALSASPAQTKSKTDSDLIAARAYLQQAEQAFHTSQWQQVCDFAQLCISAAPNDPISLNAKSMSAGALMQMKQVEQAVAVWQDLERTSPNNAGTLANIGLALTELQRSDEAIGYLERAVKLLPNDANVYYILGFAYHNCGDFARAKACYLQSVTHDPKSVKAKFRLAKSLYDEGLFEESQQMYMQIIELDPNSFNDAFANMIAEQHTRYPMNMQSQMETLKLYRQKYEDGQQLTLPKQESLRPHSPLRIGFVSGDLREHPVGYFIENTLEQLRLDPKIRNQLQLIAYHNHSVQDELTMNIHEYFDQWYKVDEWSDDRLVLQIKQDKIDILIDLSGHTRENRLSIFPLRAAHLQVSWLGYWSSTGLSSIDYVLADPISVPTEGEQWFSEKIWRLPHLRYCFSIPEEAPEVRPLPCINRPQIVFGCYQQLPKINHAVLTCWMRILTACPHARLRVQAVELEQIEIRNQFISRVQASGINMQQVDLIGTMKRKEYLESHAEVDILLDTFPYPGGTTTAAALWMGVPTITLASPSMLGRQGEALMVNAGLPDWVTHSEEEYVQKAIAWANADDHQRQDLATLRKRIREQVRLSPVFNAKQFAQDFVTAMYGMWQEKCAN